MPSNVISVDVEIRISKYERQGEAAPEIDWRTMHAANSDRQLDTEKYGHPDYLIPLALKARFFSVTDIHAGFGLRTEEWELSPDEIREALSNRAYSPRDYVRPPTVRIWYYDSVVQGRSA